MTTIYVVINQYDYQVDVEAFASKDSAVAHVQSMIDTYDFQCDEDEEEAQWQLDAWNGEASLDLALLDGEDTVEIRVLEVQP